ncbi:MAG TPA: hypothetical protein VHA70_01760 [Bauldia sp.]|nr:hypothetical protein [Bauldia sp.]
MSRSSLAIVLCFTLGSVVPSSAATPPLRFFTADGTWDCKDPAGAVRGTIIVADTSYAFVTTEGKVAGYGTIRAVDGDFDLPKFTVMSGHLKDEMKVVGLTARGPEGDRENMSGELFLNGVVGFDGKDDWHCTRRGGRANAPPA